jgi:histidine triad (HIT) family protein
MECPFCDFIHGNAPKPRLYDEHEDFVVFEPLNPVTPGHLLVVPKEHCESAADAPHLAGMTMVGASWVAKFSGPSNIITSVGSEATQTVFHLHIHVVPRAEGDGLALPWTGQKN